MHKKQKGIKMASLYINVNKSILENGKITLPKEDINSFIDVTKWAIGDSTTYKLILENKEYKGKVAYRGRDKNCKSPYFQLSYGRDLNKHLKKVFVHTFLAIEDEKITYNKEGKYHITSENFNKELLILRIKDTDAIVLTPHNKHKTEYDKVFEMMIETNLLGLEEKDKKGDIIAYSSNWIPIEEISNHKNVTNAVYYLVDTTNKEIYIGACDYLGDRVKPKRTEIPDWNMFKYEVIKPEYANIKKRIEEHSIRAFASFFENGANIPFIPVSNYILKNKNWARRN
ncbi:MAG TPA: hypothetical protein VEF53_03765 [Patescibacteria group bacterium]|nr:hypothetical protein [Patescibacteria group bacterium]